MPRSSILPLASVTLAVLTIAFGACRFDPSGLPVDPAPNFSGCFAGNDAGGVLLRLVSPESQLLVGALEIGTGPEARFYVLEGQAVNDELARLTGVLAGSSSESVPIVLLRSAVDTIAVTIETQPPLGPLNRC